MFTLRWLQSVQLPAISLLAFGAIAGGWGQLAAAADLPPRTHADLWAALQQRDADRQVSVDDGELQSWRNTSRRMQEFSSETGARGSGPFAKVPKSIPYRLDEHNIPTDFAWRDYLAMYPDVLNYLHSQTEEAAFLHFKHFGFKEGRLPRMPPIILQYTVCDSILEQLYGHLSAWVLAMRLGSATVLPPSVCKRPGTEEYHPAPLGDTLNVDKIVAVGKRQFVVFFPLDEEDWRQVQPSGAMKYNFPDLTRADPDEALPQWNPHHISPHAQMSFNVLYRQMKHVDPLVAWIQQAVGEKGRELYISNTRAAEEETTLLFQFPCMTFSLDALESLAYLEPAAKMLVFAAELEQLAAEMVAAIKRKAANNRFNGLVISSAHDWEVWTTNTFPTEYKKYERAMQAEFQPVLPCFLGFEDEWMLVNDAVRLEEVHANAVQRAGVCSALFTRNDVMREDVAAKLTLEQRTLLDMLVLRSATRLVGPFDSLMTVFLAEWRALKEDKAAVRVQTVMQVNKNRLEQDPLAHGSFFTSRHVSSTEGLPQLFVEDAARLQHYNVVL